MKKSDLTFEVELADILPQQQNVLKQQGIPAGTTISDRIKSLFATAMEMFISSAQPMGIMAELSTKEFELIFRGEGKNASDAPLQQIFPQADHLTLFALTMGSKVSLKIEELFNDNDFALASMLDSVASLAADEAVKVCEARFNSHCLDGSDEAISTSDKPKIKVLSYSPGYCGWHISGQKKFFEYLQPQRIAISLNDSFLMTPLKSVTGLLVAGKKEIHLFNNNYNFCRSCKTHSCRERLKSVT